MDIEKQLDYLLAYMDKLLSSDYGTDELQRIKTKIEKLLGL